ncbi:hypothetical protein A3K63_02850 [Candidatus Micrarchaeota archaeon RBG_16_49_10]|nr:MAG: hypothetical protein A3K63_02850 [Candidatus Micrarchaeota archaeon RBG_16_49_10]
MEKQLLSLDINDISKFFSIQQIDSNRYELNRLKTRRTKVIKIRIPFHLDNDIAKICGMIMDGSLGRDLSCLMFSQKKDPNKVLEFAKIINDKFGIEGRISYRPEGILIVNFSRSTLCNFLYYLLDMHKSDEDARIPKWIWESPEEVIRVYLRYSFAMEGSVFESIIKREIRFHTCDRPYVEQLSKLLLQKFSIKSKVHDYFIPSYGMKYYLSITNKDSIIKFSKIGFALETHQKRLERVVDSYNNKAWEITLLKLSELNMNKFRIMDVKNRLFPYLCKRSAHWRLTSLVNMGYLQLDRSGYYITDEGKRRILSLGNSVKIMKLRTRPRVNEKLVLEYLENRDSHINGISRDLNLGRVTVRDTLRRLEKQGKVRLTEIDKFQKKIYTRIKADSEGSPEAGHDQTSYGFEPSTSGL